MFAAVLFAVTEFSYVFTCVSSDKNVFIDILAENFKFSLTLILLICFCYMLFVLLLNTVDPPHLCSFSATACISVCCFCLLHFCCCFCIEKIIISHTIGQIFLGLIPAMSLLPFSTVARHGTPTH